MFFRGSRRANRALPPRRRYSLWTPSQAKDSLPVALALTLVLTAACRPAADNIAADSGQPAAPGCLPDGGAYLTGRLFGAIQAPLEWRGAALDCEGMPRPEDAGARLRFAWRIAPTNVDLVVIIGVDGLAADAKVTGRPATLTIIDETASRFYSNAGEHCWADITAQERLPGPLDSRAVTGRVYCTAALAAVNGSGSVSIDEMDFRGRIDWSPAEGLAPP